MVEIFAEFIIHRKSRLILVLSLRSSVINKEAYSIIPPPKQKSP